MMIFLGWVVFSILAGCIASNKGRSWFGFFLLSLLLSPLVGIIAAAFAKPNTIELERQSVESGEQRKCPFCAELVKIEARVCKHCGRDLVDPPSSKPDDAITPE